MLHPESHVSTVIWQFWDPNISGMDCAAALVVQLLQQLSAGAVKGAVLDAVAGAFEDFRCELQLAQQSCNTAVASASAAAQG
jgi:hypothetical protein